MTEIERFKTEVESFITARGISPTQFGRLYANDPLFVFQLRDGREPRTETRSKVLLAMQSEPAQ